MFIVVKYSANKEVLVNTNCVVASILDYIKVTTGSNLSTKESLDLASETGDMVYDLPHKLKDLGRKYLEARGTYILVKCTFDNDDSSSPSYVPLTEVPDKVKQALMNPKKKKTGDAGGAHETAGAGSLNVAADKKAGRARANSTAARPPKK